MPQAQAREVEVAEPSGLVGLGPKWVDADRRGRRDERRHEDEQEVSERLAPRREARADRLGGLAAALLSPRDGLARRPGRTGRGLRVPAARRSAPRRGADRGARPRGVVRGAASLPAW